jgi:hypothetical protein
MKENKQTYIDFIIETLNKGEVSFEKVFELFLTKFNVSRPTFAKYWKYANQKHSEQRERIEAAKMIEAIKQETKAVKAQIKSKEEIMLHVQSIMHGADKEVDQLKAADLLNKMLGYYSPTQQNVNIMQNKAPKWITDEEE